MLKFCIWNTILSRNSECLQYLLLAEFNYCILWNKLLSTCLFTFPVISAPLLFLITSTNKVTVCHHMPLARKIPIKSILLALDLRHTLQKICKGNSKE